MHSAPPLLVPTLPVDPCRPLPSPQQVATFLEANGRGYWDAQPEQLERLRQMYM